MRILSCRILLFALLAYGAAAQTAQKSYDLSLALPGLDPIVLKAKISLVFDYTGGQLRDAIKRGDRNTTVDLEKIPRNPTPYLIASALDRRSPSGIYRGKGDVDKVGDILVVPTDDEQLYAICRFNSPVAFSYEPSTPQRFERFRRLKRIKDEVDQSTNLAGQSIRGGYKIVRRDSSAWELVAGSVVVVLLSTNLRAAELLMDPEELERIITEPSSLSGLAGSGVKTESAIGVPPAPAPVPQIPQPTGVDRAAGTSSPPVLLFRRQPVYTKQARKARVEGAVQLSFTVGPDGVPRDVRVVRSLDAGLDRQAVEAVTAWRFQPGTKDGQPVSVPATIEVDFRLVNR